MPYEVYPVITETIANLDDAIDADLDEDMLVSHLASFRVNNGNLSSTFLKADDKRKHNKDRETVTVAFDNMTLLNDQTVNWASDKKKEACVSLKNLLEAKFDNFTAPVFKNMRWFNPQNWDSANLKSSLPNDV